MVEQKIDQVQQPESDLEIYENVLSAIENDMVIRESRVPISISVKNGVVTVGGIVCNEIMRGRVLFAAATVPGVSKVIDQLYIDSDIEKTIARALATDPGVGQLAAAIRVSSYEGIVTLAGTVTGAEQKDAIVALAAKAPGVRQINNLLEVTETNQLTTGRS